MLVGGGCEFEFAVTAGTATASAVTGVRDKKRTNKLIDDRGAAGTVDKFHAVSQRSPRSPPTDSVRVNDACNFGTSECHDDDNNNNNNHNNTYNNNNDIPL